MIGVRFLVDAQLPPALARWLASQGHEAEHVTDIGLASARDLDIWKYAQTTGAVIISKDEDRRQPLRKARQSVLKKLKEPQPIKAVTPKKSKDMEL